MIRHCRGWIAVIALSLMAFPVQAQLNPQRQITLVVALAPGGGVDAIARLIAEKLPDKLKIPVVVENRPGAGGMVGAETVAKAPPDGHTLLLMENSSTLHKWLHKSVPYDVTVDFAPVSLIASTPLLVFAHPSMSARDVKGVIDIARASPGKWSMGTPGVGTPHHLAHLLMTAAAKVDILHVPYRGTGPSLNDLLGGQIPMIWATPIAVMPHVTAGKVKALGTASKQRLASLPNVPTIAENALPGFNVDIWFGLGVPGKTPRATVERLATAVREVTEMPEVQARMKTLGFELDYRGPDAFRTLIGREHERAGKAIRDAGIVPN